jgi:hypothetical protein
MLIYNQVMSYKLRYSIDNWLYVIVLSESRKLCFSSFPHLFMPSQPGRINSPGAGNSEGWKQDCIKMQPLSLNNQWSVLESMYIFSLVLYQTNPLPPPPSIPTLSFFCGWDTGPGLPFSQMRPQVASERAVWQTRNALFKIHIKEMPVLES